MDINITTNFTENGVPKTSLTPLISIWKLSDNSLVVDDASMSEVGGGIYKYVFESYSVGESYSIRCDGGETLDDYDRYTWATSNEEDLILRILKNKLELSNGSSDNWVLYDDDDTTPLLSFSVTDVTGSHVTSPKGVPAKRSKGE
jgi:hypothetical protein